MAQSVSAQANLRSLGQLLVVHLYDHAGHLPLAGNIVPGSDLTGVDDPATLGDSLRRNYEYCDNGGGQLCVTALPAALASYITSQSVHADSWQNVDADIQAHGAFRMRSSAPPIRQRSIARMGRRDGSITTAAAHFSTAGQATV